MRITFLQTGDFRDAARRIAESGQETYHAQRHSMSVVDRLAASVEHVAVVCVSSQEPYRERLPSNVEVHGFALYGGKGRDMAALSAILAETRPTHVVLRFPDAEVLKLCLKRGVKVLPAFADTFAPRRGWKRALDLLRHRRLARLLNDDRIACIGNHNIAASDSLVRIGVRAGKVIPWDWPRPHHPGDYVPKTLERSRPLRLLTVGAVSESKGVGDAIRALARLPHGGPRLTIVGHGETELMRRIASEAGVSDRVEIRGQIPFSEVLPTMRDHDVLIVFTRASYAEGLPGVLYQGLAARMPILASPHPVFRHYFEDGRDLLFAASHEPEALAHRIRDLAGDPALYARLSENTEAAFERIVLDTDWVELVERWLDEDDAWLAERCLPKVRQITASG